MSVIGEKHRIELKSNILIGMIGTAYNSLVWMFQLVNRCRRVDIPSKLRELSSINNEAHMQISPYMLHEANLASPEVGSMDRLVIADRCPQNCRTSVDALSTPLEMGLYRRGEEIHL